MDISIMQADGSLIPDAHPAHVDVFGPNGELLPMLSRKLSIKGRQRVEIPTRIGDPAGKWRIRVRDCLTGREDTKEVISLAHPLAASIPPVKDIFSPLATPKKINISDGEFISLLGALRELYLTGGDRDKGSLSYYAQDRDVSRNRIMQLLNQADWLEKLPALKSYLDAGNTIILLGEDLGYDPASGLWLDPVNGQGYDDSMDMSAASDIKPLSVPNKLEALEKITKDRIGSDCRLRERMEIKVGKGRLILDPISFDDLGQANGLFDLNHSRFIMGQTGVK